MSDTHDRGDQSRRDFPFFPDTDPASAPEPGQPTEPIPAYARAESDTRERPIRPPVTRPLTQQGAPAGPSQAGDAPKRWADPVAPAPSWQAAGGPPPAGASRPPAAQPRRSGLVPAALVGALTLGVLGGVGGAVAYERLTGDEQTTTTTTTDPVDPVDLVSVNSVTEKVLPSVVKITFATDDGSGGFGSGSVLSADGEILTNAHVISLIDEEGGTITVSTSDGRNLPADIVGYDPFTDLGLIQVQDVDDLTPIEVGDSDANEVGQAVVAVGSPYGLDATVTAGIVSALHRPLAIPTEDDDVTSYYDAIQTDAPINPGNSGGALVNMAGEQVGVNSANRSAESADPYAQGDLGNTGIGYAIPMNQAMAIVEQLRDGETPTHARLGVSGEDAELSPGVTGGAQVESVEEGSAADAAGIEEDDVITQVGDVHIASFEALGTSLLGYRPGESVDVIVNRDGEQITLTPTFDSDADTD